MSATGEEKKGRRVSYGREESFKSLYRGEEVSFFFPLKTKEMALPKERKRKKRGGRTW